ncbi:MAG: NADH-quinone oxidoreductase subunit L [Phycisphaeraceae bacterium]|nr:NADH-quinone oxidoreductase subunit L [Phycisphaeraceae bacterium]
MTGLTPVILASTGSPAATHQGAWWMALIPFLPLLSCVLCGLVACVRPIRSTKLPAWITVVSLGVSFALMLATYGQQREGWASGASVTTAWEWIHLSWGHEPGQTLIANFGFYMDGLSGLWMLFVTGLGTLIALYASEYMAHDKGLGYCRFFAAFSLFVFSMACLVMGDNLILLYLGWEGVGLCSYLLIGYFYKKPSAVAAAKKAFIMNRIGDLGLALGVMLTFFHFGTVQYAELFPLVQPHIDSLKAGRVEDIPLLVQAIPVLLMIGAFGKSAQLPLYVWLPDAMEGPTPVSALIHAATMVTAGVYLIARTMPLFLVSEWALPVVAWVGALTALLAATIGMAQFDIKRIMAYSTVSQLGYMFAGLAFLSSTGAAFHVFTHAFFKATLFLCCGAVMHGFAGQLDLRRLSGVMFMRGWLIVGVAMLVGCLNLSGFPFTAGFFSKDMILAEAFVTPGYQLLGWILILTAGLTAYYTFRVFFRVFVGPRLFEPGDEVHADDDHGHADHAHDGHAPAGDGHSAEPPTPQPHDADHSFHPHPPGWAINTVLALLAVLSLAAAGAYFIEQDRHGWVGSMVHDSTAAQVSIGEGEHAVHAAAFRHDLTHEEHAHATLLGMNPHDVMYFVSAIVGVIGILIAAALHGPKGIGGLMIGSRTEAARSRADELLPRLGPIPRWAQHKWFVDEFYEFLIRRPLYVASCIFHLIDALLVDGLVNLFGWLPRRMGKSARRAQSGVLHQYAGQMAGGLVIVLFIVLLLTA